VNDNGDHMNTKEEVDIFQIGAGDEVVSNHIKISDMENNLTNIPDDVLMQLFEEVDNQQCTDVDPMFILLVASAEQNAKMESEVTVELMTNTAIVDADTTGHQ